MLRLKNMGLHFQMHVGIAAINVLQMDLKIIAELIMIFTTMYFLK